MVEKLLMLPGPTHLPNRVLRAMSRPVISHRGEEFHHLYESVEEGLRYVFQTRNNVFILTASGTGGVEFAVNNFIGRRDKVIVPITGVFASRMATAISRRGASVIKVDLGLGDHLTPEKLEEILRKHKDASVLSLVFNETSTGVSAWRIVEIGRVAKEHGLLFIVDSISALGGVDIPTDKAMIDVHIAGSQKCIAAPPGLSFVAVSSYAEEKAGEVEPGSFYFDFSSYKRFASKSETPFTPAVPLLYALEESLKMIREEGLENVFKRHSRAAEALYAALSTLGFSFVAKPEFRSKTVIAAYPPRGVDAYRLKAELESKYGVVIAGGMGELKGKIIRIGVMGRVSTAAVTRTVSSLESLLYSLGVYEKIGDALRAALEHLH